MSHGCLWEKYYENRKLPGDSKKGSFWWRDVLKLLDKFKGMARVQINNGKSCHFWEDLWGNDLLSHRFPELFSFAKKKKITFAEGATQVPIHSLFHLPLSQQAHEQIIQLQVELEGLHLSNLPDSWQYIWNSNMFSVRRAYKHLSGHLILHPVYRWLWKSACQNKYKVFFWLLIKDRLSTRELLKRKNMELQDYNCILCNGDTEESLVHLFLGCPFATHCWTWLQIRINLHLEPLQILDSFREQLQVPFFMEVIILMCWTIWRARNDRIFQSDQSQSSYFKGLLQRRTAVAGIAVEKKTLE